MGRSTYALPTQNEQLDLFRALPGEMAPRDAQDLMANPFFSLAKSRRTTPIDFRSGEVTVRVEGTLEHGIATIWDADILIWAASQIVEARDAGIPTSRLMRATPYQILRFIGRGTSLRDYQRLKAALDRLQSTSVATSIRETTGRRLHRFSWINEWKERADARGRPLGLELIVPDWFYAAVLDDALDGRAVGQPHALRHELRHAGLHAGIRHGQASREVVTPVQYHGGTLDDLRGVMPPNPSGDRAGIENRIEPADPISRSFGLGTANVGGRIDRLALQVGRFDHVIVDQRQPPDPGTGKVLQGG